MRSYGSALLGPVLLVSSTESTGVEKEKKIELVQLGTAGSDRLRLPAFAQHGRLPEAEVSDVTFEIIQKWINACVSWNSLPETNGRLPSGHGRCDKNDFKPLPKRVLNLQTKRVRLLEPNQEDWGKYACLSYCWGSVEFLRTLTSNLEQHRQEIPWNKTPRLFCDVVKVCRRLSIPYLWIDALCIIQDSDNDWVEQASKMAEIYGNSFLTIAATAAQDPSRSLFKRYPAPTELYTIPHESHHGLTFTTRPAMEHPWRCGEIHGSSYPLQKRGWVLQEDCLPPRTLHFLNGEVALACCEGMICECCDTDPAGVERWEESNAQIDYTSPKNFPAVRSPGGRTENDTIQSWHSVVQMYTSTSLTRASDKLPALSGLAKAMRRDDMKDEYLAGLWKSSLMYDLLWKLYSSPAHKSETYRAPSWSWASVDGTVYFDGSFQYGSLSLACEVLEARCETSTKDDYGQVCDGKLVLMGKLLRGALEYEPSADWEWSDSRWKFRNMTPSSDEAWVKCEGTSFMFKMDHQLSKSGISAGAELELFYLCDGGLDRYGDRVIICLVLYRKPGFGQCRERVGLWSTHFGRHEQNSLLREAFQKPSPQRVEIR